MEEILKKYGNWTVLRDLGLRENSMRWVLCRCKCGKRKVILLNNLKQGKSIQCRRCSKIGNKNTVGTKNNLKHGKSHTREYKIYYGMLDRCYNPKNIGYKNYGGRGIKVCKRWLNSFEKFYADMGPRPSREYSIERINNDGDYKPSNCIWATKSEQNRNQRRWKKLLCNY